MYKYRVIFFIVMIIIFISAMYIIDKNKSVQTTATLLTDKELLPSLVSDMYLATDSIYCASYMFKLDRDIINISHEPISMISNALISAKKRGVDVKLLFELGRSDEITTKFNKKTARILAKDNITIFFDSPDTRMHSKVCVIDNNIVYIGSHNITFSAMKRNNEASVRVISREIAAETTEYLNSIINIEK